MDITTALSAAALAVKDENELVSLFIFCDQAGTVKEPADLWISGLCVMLHELAQALWRSSSLRKCLKFWMKRKK